MGTNASKNDVINESITVTQDSAKTKTEVIFTTIFISLLVTLIRVFLLWKIRKLFKKQVEKYSINRV
jgi:hypothetical protein